MTANRNDIPQPTSPLPEPPTAPIPRNEVPGYDMTKDPSVTAGAYLVGVMHQAGAKSITHAPGQLDPLPIGLTDMRFDIPGIGITRIRVNVEIPAP